jgi:hypothetical protein
MIRIVAGRTIRTGGHYTTFREEMWRRQGGTCECGRHTSLTNHLMSDYSFHVHHRRGRGMGGSRRDDTFAACVGLCGFCHRKEHGQ